MRFWGELSPSVNASLIIICLENQVTRVLYDFDALMVFVEQHIATLFSMSDTWSLNDMPQLCCQTVLSMFLVSKSAALNILPASSPPGIGTAYAFTD